MKKEECDDLLNKIIALERELHSGNVAYIQRKTLKILAKLVIEIYNTQHEK